MLKFIVASTLVLGLAGACGPANARKQEVTTLPGIAVTAPTPAEFTAMEKAEHDLIRPAPADFASAPCLFIKKGYGVPVYLDEAATVGLSNSFDNGPYAVLLQTEFAVVVAVRNGRKDEIKYRPLASSEPDYILGYIPIKRARAVQGGSGTLPPGLHPRFSHTNGTYRCTISWKRVLK